MQGWGAYNVNSSREEEEGTRKKDGVSYACTHTHTHTPTAIDRETTHSTRVSFKGGIKAVETKVRGATKVFIDQLTTHWGMLTQLYQIEFK